MLIFHVKYKSGATFTQELRVNAKNSDELNVTRLKYYMALFWNDPEVQRVLVRVK